MRLLEPGYLEEDYPITKFFWKQKILKFYATVENLNTVELTWPLRKQPLK